MDKSDANFVFEDLEEVVQEFMKPDFAGIPSPGLNRREAIEKAKTIVLKLSPDTFFFERGDGEALIALRKRNG